MKVQRKGTTVIFGPARISYAHLFKPHAIGQDDTPKYGLSAIIPKAEEAVIKELKAAIAEAGARGAQQYPKWNGKIPTVKHPIIKDGDERINGDEAYAGAWYIDARCKTRPGVLGPDKQPVLDEDEVYSGCYCNVSVTAFPYDTAMARGVSLGLNNVMKVRDGEPLGSRMSAASDFADWDAEEGGPGSGWDL